MTDCGTILVVDHDDRTRLAAVQAAVRLGYEVSAAENAELALERLASEPPVLAIVEVELPGQSSGLELLRELHDRYGDRVPVILVSGGRTTPLDRVAGLLLGADDYLVKPVDAGELLARVRRSLRRVNGSNGTHGSNGANGNGHAPSEDGPRVSLSPREHEILTLLAEGNSQKQIAAALVISPKTVGTHIQHLLAKLGVHSRAQAVSAAFQLGLVESDVAAHALVVEELVPAE